MPFLFLPALLADLWSGLQQRVKKQLQDQETAVLQQPPVRVVSDQSLLDISEYFASLEYLSPFSFLVRLYPKAHTCYMDTELFKNDKLPPTAQYLAGLRRCYSMLEEKNFIYYLFAAAIECDIGWGLFRFMRSKGLPVPALISDTLELTEDVPVETSMNRLLLLLAREFSYHGFLRVNLATNLEVRRVYQVYGNTGVDCDLFAKVVLLYHVLEAGYNKHKEEKFWRLVRESFKDSCLGLSYKEFLASHDMVHLFSLGEKTVDGEVPAHHQLLASSNPLQSV